MDLGIAGRICVITGGSRGIGLETARMLREEGAKVLLVARDAGRLDAAAESLDGGEDEVVTLPLDITVEDSGEQMLGAATEAFGGVDVLVNNAGIMKLAKLADSEDALFDQHIAINLKGTFNTLREAARRLRDGGRIVNFSSSVVGLKTESYGVYAATKAAINALCRALAVELARYGVTANAILPGWIRSEMTAGVMANEKFVANVMPRIPVRRFGEPGDFGGIAVYLMSKASSYHTADCFVIDGGYAAF